MSRPARIILRIGAILGGIIVVVIIAALIVVRTTWFHNYIRDKIITYAEAATGGKVEIQSFGFEWTHLHASLTGFVLHGTEPPGVTPLFTARRVDVNLKVLPSLNHIIQLQYLGIDQPKVNVVVYADGHTNVPAPKVKPASNTTVLQDFVNLAISKFDIQNGSLQFAQYPQIAPNEGTANRSKLAENAPQKVEENYEFSAHGENLRAQLSYNFLPGTYDGQIAMAPLRLQQAGRPPVELSVTLPLHLEQDKVQLNNASITTAGSQIHISGEIDRMLDPQMSAHVTGNIALDDLKQATALPIAVPPHGPGVLNADLTLAIDKDHVRATNSRITLGNSSIEASGALKDPSGNTNMQLKASLELDELGRVLKTRMPHDKLTMETNARLAGTTLNLDNLKVATLGGSFDGSVDLEDMRRYKVDGRLANFDIAEMARVFANERLGYDGRISGPIRANGDLQNAGALRASAHLSIAPGRRGVPVSGQLNADYNASTDSIDVAKSYLALPN